jgi:geranylgeranyl pyrophosphate synthase
VLDLTETAEKTGKDASNDLSNHRLTLPLIRALRVGSNHEQQRMRDLLTSSDPDDQARLRDEPLIRQGVESARGTAEHFVRRALRNLASLPPCSAREILAAIAQFAIDRSA